MAHWSHLPPLLWREVADSGGDTSELVMVDKVRIDLTYYVYRYIMYVGSVVNLRVVCLLLET